YRNLQLPDTPEAADDRRCRRHISVTPLDDGLVRLVAVLEPHEAALVVAALDARGQEHWRCSRGRDAGPPRELAERRADALVEVATEGLVIGPDPIVRGERIEVRVHVDREILAGARDDGICHIEGIGAVAPSIARMLCCDATWRGLLEVAPGVFDLGRT